MKKMMIALAAASFVSIQATTQTEFDVIANAIKNNNVESLTTLALLSKKHAGNFGLPAAKKATYVEQAKATLAKLQNESSFSFDATMGLDWLSLTASAALATGGGISIYDTWHSKDDKKNRNTLAGMSALLIGLGNLIKSAKDIYKGSTEHACKKAEKVKKAEQVVELIEALPTV